MAVRQLGNVRADRNAPGASSIPPIWHESLWPLDWMALRLSPVYYGLGVPRGDGSAVVLVPGFLGSDAYLVELYGWLGRIGYRPFMSGIGLNAECPGRLATRLITTMERAQAATGRPVRIVGHSLGGMIGRRAATQRPELVSQLICLGSPLQAVHAHPAVVATAVGLHTTLSALSGGRYGCLAGRCKCGFTRDLAIALPPGIRHSAIFTRSDGVVDWHDAQEIDQQLNHEVGGTHIGLVFNPRAYRALGQLLVTPELAEQPAETPAVALAPRAA
ncbi:MAG: hypothetical protein E6J42_04985 [Chloroflexi bacterium]|nr:MAG: hypothetical protein E6J42_04985 [Chloroflexota bacterium]